MILFQNYAGQWLPWMVSAFLFLCFIAPELSDDNSGGHPRVPFPSGNGGLYHRRPICHGRRYRPAARRAITPRGPALDATKQSSPLPASHFQPTRHTPKLQVRFAPDTMFFFVSLTFYGSWFGISVSRRTRCPPLLLSSTRQRARRRRGLSTRGAGRALGQPLSRLLRKGWVNLFFLFVSWGVGRVPFPNL